MLAVGGAQQGNGNIVVVDATAIGAKGKGGLHVREIAKNGGPAIYASGMPKAPLVVKGKAKQTQSQLVPECAHGIQTFLLHQLSPKEGLGKAQQIGRRRDDSASPQRDG